MLALKGGKGVRERMSLFRELLCSTFSLVILLSVFPLSCQAQPVEMTVNFPGPVAISRHVGFSAQVPSWSARLISRETVKLSINGEDQTRWMQQVADPDSGDLLLHFKPYSPLPEGDVIFKIFGLTSEGRLFEKRWKIIVDPGKDPYLLPFVQAVRRKPGNPEAHFHLALAFEKKYLLEDAQDEYRKVLDLNPHHQKAQSAYDRIFSLWGRKAIARENIVIDVTMDEGLLSMGGVLLFKVMVENRTLKEVTFNPDAATLVDDYGNQLPPLKELLSYPKQALDAGWITLEEYARISYFLETHPMTLLSAVTIYPGVSVSGYLIFRLPRREVRTLTLVLAEVHTPRKYQTFKFPFVRP